jgi:hypothetical protein
VRNPFGLESHPTLAQALSFVIVLLPGKETDLERLGGEMGIGVRETMQPAHASL